MGKFDQRSLLTGSSDWKLLHSAVVTEISRIRENPPISVSSEKEPLTAFRDAGSEEENWMETIKWFRDRLNSCFGHCRKETWPEPSS